MRKFIYIFAIAISFYNAQACDICGCGGGNFYMGLLPNFKTGFVGIRYHYIQFHTQLANNISQFSHNYYNTTEIWGGWNIGKKFQLLAFVPYYFNKQADDDGTTYKNGLGDITLVMNYQLLHTRSMNNNNKNVEQILWIGGGIKLPTGTFKVNPDDSTTTLADINAQIGTGSTDFLLNALYNVRVGFFGVSTSANYKIGTTNNSDYKFGNKFTGSSIAYYRFRFHGVGISPNAGGMYEHTDVNFLNKEKVQYTGSYIVSAIAGVEFNFNRIAVGISAQSPLVQNFAEGQTKMQFRGMAHVTFAL
ncbi:MAG TPA: transporter [Puia sp.]|nr:transporter [Puia sp.]